MKCKFKDLNCFFSKTGSTIQVLDSLHILSMFGVEFMTQREREREKKRDELAIAK